MKVSDYIADFIYGIGVHRVFGITGGYIAHIFDSIDKYPNLEYICTNHEQGAAMAADGYARLTGKIGVAISTSGPGAANLINGVMCAHFDSIPLLVITGQCPTKSILNNGDTRQRGFQELRVKEVFKPFTKYSTIVMSPNDVLYELEKAYCIAMSGRPGAVVVDIPDDIQRADINTYDVRHYIPEAEHEMPIDGQTHMLAKNFMGNARRPLFILGAGIRIDHCEGDIRKVINTLQIPFVTTWGGTDLFPFSNNLNIGNFGTIGTKYGNMAVQEADVLVAIGTRLDEHLTTSNLKSFGKDARKIVVDIDQRELQKLQDCGLGNAMYINTSVKNFLDLLLTTRVSRQDDWIAHLQDLKQKYPICKECYKEETEFVNPYVFLDTLATITKLHDIIITDAGANLSYAMQGYKVSGTQRLFSDFNNSSMGYSLPASIGASFARNKGSVICIIGDGAFQMNVQELAIIKKHDLPIKIFIFNNQGYGMIKQTQDDWLDSRYTASTEEGGLAMADNLGIARAYGLESFSINNHNDLSRLTDILAVKLAHNKGFVCNVNISPDQRITPKLQVGKKLEEI